jgi:histone-lysine N-methyltransferase EZH2
MYGQGGGSAVGADDADKVPLPRIELFSALAQLITPVPTTKDIVDRFTDLCAQRQKIAKESVKALVPDADSPASAMDSSKMFHSFQNLFCNQCLVYDCSVHQFHPNPTTQRAQDADGAGPAVPLQCGPDCQLQTSKRPAKSPKRAKAGKAGAASSSVVAGLCANGHRLQQFSNSASVVTLGKRHACVACPKAISLSTLVEGWCCPTCADFVLCNSCAIRDPFALAMSGFRGEVASDRPIVSKVKGSKRNVTARAAKYLPATLSSAITDATAQVWSLAERTFFENATKIFKFDFCGVSTYIGTKTCREVRDYATANGFGMPPPAVPAETPEIDTGEIGGKRKAKAKLTKAGKVANRGHNARPYQKKEWRPDDMEDGEETEHGSYTPCDCEGECGQDCLCVSSNNWCEKFCQCNGNCRNRFAGCNCNAGCDTKACPCFIANHECDPDICRCDCGCNGERMVGDLHQLKHTTEKRCSNAVLQQGHGTGALMY